MADVHRTVSVRRGVFGLAALLMLKRSSGVRANDGHRRRMGNSISRRFLGAPVGIADRRFHGIRNDRGGTAHGGVLESQLVFAASQPMQAAHQHLRNSRSGELAQSRKRSIPV